MNLPLQNVFGHQLALTAGLALTPPALDEGLSFMKRLGFNGCVVVPKAWDPSLTAKIAAEIASKHSMSLQTCGFLPGNEFSPHSQTGHRAALDEIHRQMQIQIEFIDAGIGEQLLCGPIDIGWKSREFNQDGYNTWLDALNQLASEQGLQLAIEPLNGVESPVPNAFTTLSRAIAELKCLRTGIQFDTGHAKARGVSMNQFVEMTPLIWMFEFANVGRHPLSWRKGINFPGYARNMHLLQKHCVVSDEPFDPIGVINPLGLQAFCTTTTLGKAAMTSNTRFLKKLGVMSSS